MTEKQKTLVIGKVNANELFAAFSKSVVAELE